MNHNAAIDDKTIESEEAINKDVNSSESENVDKNSTDNNLEKGKENAPKRSFRNFRINFTRAIIISIILHIIAAVIYSVIIEPEPFDIPSVEVKIKIGSSGFSEIAPIVEKPKIKKIAPRKKTDNSKGNTKLKDRKKVSTRKKEIPENRQLNKKKEQEKQIAKNKKNEAIIGDKKEEVNIDQEKTIITEDPVIIDEILETEKESKKIKEGEDNRNTKNSLGEELGNKKDAIQTVAQDYEEKVSLWIGSKKFMPQHTIDKLRELEVYDDLYTSLYIKINRKGDILDMFVTESSGYDFIDNLTLEIATRSSPVPVMPDDMTPEEDKFHFFITLKYPVTRWQKELRLENNPDSIE